MKAWIERWQTVGIIAVGLFLLNVAARWIAKWLKDDSKQNVAGIITLVVIAAIFFGFALYWGRIRPISRIATDLGFAAVAGCLLSVLVGPFLAGSTPFANGPGAFFAQIWLYAALAGGGTALGLIVLTAFTADYKSKQLKAFADKRKGVPKRL